MKSIIVIIESIDIEDSSASKGRVALIQNLRKAGYVIKVLHYTRKKIELGNNIICIPIPEVKLSITYFLSRIQRIIQRNTKINLSNFFENIFGFSFTFFNDVKAIKKSIYKNYNNEDIILTLSKGGSFRPHYAMLNFPNLHSKWVAYVHDPYPFHFYPRPYNWVESGYKFKENFFREVSIKAKYSLFPSQLLKEWMGSYFPDFLNTGLVIPHQYLENSSSNNTKNSEYFTANKFNLLHAGNLMKPRNPKGLIEAYELFLKEFPEAKENSKLIFLGNADYFKTYLTSKQSKNIYWSNGYVPYSEVENIQNLTSVNIILEAKSEISPFLPGKFPHCIHANKPIMILGPYYSECRRLLGHSYEFVSEIDNIPVIKQHITKLYINWKSNIDQSLDRKDLKEYLSMDNLRKQFEHIE